MTAVLGLTAALKQPTSAKSHAAINLLNAVAEAAPQLSAVLPGAGAGATGGARAGAGAAGAAAGASGGFVTAVRCLRAACELVGSAGSQEAVVPLRDALVAANVGSRLVLSLLSGAGGTLAAPRVMAAIAAAWTSEGLRDEVFLDGFWDRWAQPVVDRARLYASGAAVGQELPTLGHITVRPHTIYHCLCLMGLLGVCSYLVKNRPKIDLI